MRYAVKSAPPPGGEPDEFVMSDNTVDRMGDVIEASSWQLDRIKSDPPVLFNHNSDQIVGRWTNIRKTGTQLIGRIAWTTSDKWPMAQYIRDLVREGILRTVSVGFQPLERQPLTKDASKEYGPWRFTKSELLECSLVAVPANPNALLTAKSLGLPGDILTEVFRKPAEPRLGPHAKPGKPLLPQGKSPMKTLSQRIEDAQNAINRMRDQLAELSNKDDRTEEEEATYSELNDEIESRQAALEKDRRTEKNIAARARGNQEHPPIDGEVIPPSEPKRLFAIPKKKIEPEDFLVRSMALVAMSIGRREPLNNVLASVYGNDEQTGVVLRAATTPALTTTVGWAADLVQTAIDGYIDRLLNDSIYGPLSSRGARFTFGRNGAIKIPSRGATPNLAGSWVGEAQPKPVKQAIFSSITLSPHKLAVISVFSEEMAEYSTPAIEGIIRDAMRNDTSMAIDGFLIDNVAASATRPAGLLNGLTTLTPSADTNKTNAMIADVKALRQAIITNGGGRDIVLVMHSAQQTGIDLAQTPNGLLFPSAAEGASRFGVGLIVSNTVPAGTVIAIDAADFASATGDVPRYSISTDATIHMEDTTPLAIASGAQGSGVLATPTRSLWQTDCIGIRMTWPLSWGMRRTGMVAFMSGVTW